MPRSLRARVFCATLRLNSAVARASQNKIVSTIRGTEVVCPTNECARRAFVASALGSQLAAYLFRARA